MTRYRLSAQLTRGDSLDARLSLTGSGTDPDSASVQASISGSAAYRTHRLSDASLELALDRGLARVAGGGTLDGAELELKGSAKPFGPETAVNLEQIRFEGLDLSRLAGAIPIEMFGGSVFPRIGTAAYIMMMGPYDFYWFRLRRL